MVAKYHFIVSIAMFPLFFRHVVIGSKLSAEDVTDGPVDTLGGEKINLKKKEDGGIQVEFNGKTANVVETSLTASNGIIHFIDAILL